MGTDPFGRSTYPKVGAAVFRAGEMGFDASQASTLALGCQIPPLQFWRVGSCLRMDKLRGDSPLAKLHSAIDRCDVREVPKPPQLHRPVRIC